MGRDRYRSETYVDDRRGRGRSPDMRDRHTERRQSSSLSPTRSEPPAARKETYRGRPPSFYDRESTRRVYHEPPDDRVSSVRRMDALLSSRKEMGRRDRERDIRHRSESAFEGHYRRDSRHARWVDKRKRSSSPRVNRKMDLRHTDNRSDSHDLLDNGPHQEHHSRGRSLSRGSYSSRSPSSSENVDNRHRSKQSRPRSRSPSHSKERRRSKKKEVRERSTSRERDSKRSRKEKHRPGKDERRSILTGKKIKLKVKKEKGDNERDANRRDLLQFLNSAYE